MNEQLATTGDRKDVRSAVENMKSQFAMALPRILTAERFIRVALTCINKNPKLLACTRDSLLACLLDCAQLGIEPDGRRAHLIPFNDRKNNRVLCTLIIDYKGIAELVRRSGEISTLHAGIVYPDDEFDYAFGTGQYLKHKPTLNRANSKPIAVYSYVKLKDGQEDFDVMGIEEVEKIRKRSRAANDGPWVTDFDEMAKKSAFRRHSKWLPLSPELREKIEKDDEPLTQQERFAAAKPIQEVVNGIQFGPAEVEREFEPEVKEEPVQEEPPKPKRHRRTKAEMDAARSEDGGSIQLGPESRAEAEAAIKKIIPPRATPLEGLRNLIAASPLEEKQLVHHLITKMALEPHQNLENISEEKVIAITQEFMVLAAEILDGKLEEEETPLPF